MSWKALDWVAESDIRSPTTKLILFLLANKADEEFSCYPSIGTLIAESGAGRSTVMRALKTLEANGFITRRQRFHDSGAQRSTRYYLSHPQAPHMPGPNVVPPGPNPTSLPSQRETGPVPDRDPTGVSDRAPLNPPYEPPTKPGTDVMRVIDALPDTWRIGRRDAGLLIPSIEKALASGWSAERLVAQISGNPEGVRHPAKVLSRRLADLPDAPSPARPTAVAWCGECEDERSRTITVTMPNGVEAAAFCPRCSPQAQRSQSKRGMEVNQNGGQSF
ncbi:helix-turn-helix domain-containing protein [Mycolicibacterium fortuitum]|uniref:helix-turn-helix domain-containing protein n=1 Tax=Mycolicibacterium fortuitum TaxID=1766 RepID=UPI00260F595E|nr:helix-turn-helix domain-containing protein [Mycolicibacterium fortuitum]